MKIDLFSLKALDRELHVFKQTAPKKYIGHIYKMFGIERNDWTTKSINIKVKMKRWQSLESVSSSAVPVTKIKFLLFQIVFIKDLSLTLTSCLMKKF